MVYLLKIGFIFTSEVIQIYELANLFARTKSYFIFDKML